MATLLALALTVAAPAFQTPLFGTPSTGAFLVFDIDGDGSPELLVAVDDRLLVLDAAGKTKSETTLPARATPLEAKAGAPPQKLAIDGNLTLCDVDPAFAPTVAFTSNDGRLFALALKQGRWLAGFPLLLDSVATSAPVCAELASGKKHVLIGTHAGALHAFTGAVANGKGKEAAGFPVQLGQPITALAAGAPRPSERLRIFAATENGLLHARATDGKPVAGYPVNVGYRLGGAPVIADIDDDGDAEVVVASQDFKIYAFASSGAVVAGFPFTAGYRFYAAPALGDLDDDGVLDIAAAGADGKLYALKGNGQALPGFPVALGPKFSTSPLIADIDGDGHNDVVAVAPDGSVFAVDSHARTLAGTPLSIGDTVKAPLLLAVSAGELALYAVGAKSANRLAPFARKAPLDPSLPLPWPMLGHDHTRAGRYFPNEGRYRALSLTPNKPATNDVLKASYVFFDMDGDTEQGTQIRWYKNDAPLDALKNQTSVPTELTKKHERYRFTLQDGRNWQAFGEKNVYTRLFRSPEVEIANTAPTAPLVAIAPDRPHNHNDLAAVIKQAARDEDGDTLSYDYRWQLDRRPQALARSQTRIGHDLTKKHQRWTLVVTAKDGEAEGPPASAEIVIANTPPEAAKVTLDPARPSVASDVHAVIATPAADADGDTITYRYAWSIDGVAQSLPPDVDTLPKLRLHKNQAIELVVTSFDGDDSGGQTTARARTVNTLPTPPSVAFAPARPRKAEGLRAFLPSAAFDADNDPVSYVVAWALGGKPTADSGWRIEPAQVQKGQQWRVSVVAKDDEGAQAAVSADSVILNSPPRGLRVALDDYRPRVTHAVKVQVQTLGTDDDNDPVQLRYAWTKDGKAQAFPASKDTLLPREAKKGEHWRVLVTAHDGSADGDAQALDFDVQNTPPSAPRVRLEPAVARAGMPISAKISAPAEDDDRDALTYRYRWFCDGKQVSLADTVSELPPGIVKKGQTIRVEVFAFDGEALGPAGFATTLLENTAPSAPSVALEPSRATVQAPLVCRAAAPAQDADGDRLDLELEWTLDGKPYAAGPGVSTLHESELRRGQRWACRMRASDGSVSGAWSAPASAQIQNSAPSEPGLSLLPKAPTVQEDLLCVVSDSAKDADRDRLDYAFFWTKNGKKDARFKGARVPKSALEKGERWACGVIVSDGLVSTREVWSEAVIGNAAPTAPDVAVLPTLPSAGAPLRCQITVPAADADGDALTYRFQWFKDGVAQGFAATTTEVPARLVRAKDVWTCAASAFDGQAESAPTRSVEAVVRAE